MNRQKRVSQRVWLTYFGMEPNSNGVFSVYVIVCDLAFGSTNSIGKQEKNRYVHHV